MVQSLDISVVTFNSEKWLASFFLSLMRQSFPCGQIRLLLRDNGSTDQTQKLLEEFKKNNQCVFQYIHTDLGSNTGFGSGHNANLALAESNFFLVTNVDLEFESDTLSVLLNTASCDEAPAAAWECRQKPYEHPKHYDPVTSESGWCSSACILFRTSALVALGGYEPRLFMYGEDVELSYRLRDHGYVLRYTPKAVVWHYSYEEAGQVKPLQFLGSTTANVLLRCRYGRWYDVITGFFMYMGLFIVPQQFPRQRRLLFTGLFKVLKLTPYFLRTRRRSKIQFSFRLWDYEMVREGAFHAYERVQSGGALPNRTVVSVIVRTMPGRSGKLREALISVAAQTYPHIELVVVEDGGHSAQETADAYREAGRFRSVVYLPQAKIGRCLAGNAALAAATGELVCFLDDDDLFYADHLEVLVSAWEKNPTLGAVYALSFQIRTDIKSHEPWVYHDVEHSVIYRQEFSRVLMWHHNYLPIQTVLFRRDLYVKYGGFDADLENLEDWNLWVRYSLHHDFLMVPKVTSLYRVPAGNAQAVERQTVLDDYYAKAQQKHSTLRLEVSPTDVLKMSEALTAGLHVAGIPVHGLRKLVMRVPVLRLFYNPLRRIYHLVRKVKNRRRA